MNSIVKLNSNEGGIFTGTNNKISFDIPEGGHYDLSTAFINLIMTMPIASETAPLATDAGSTALPPLAGVYCPNVKFFDGDGTHITNVKYENSALLRSCVMSCDKKGSIERIQRADIITQNLNNFSYSQDAATSTLYERIIQEVPLQTFKSSMFVDQIKEGLDVSRNLTRQPVKIKLSDVMNFCKVQQYSTEKYGRTKVELEVNMDKLTAVQYLGPTDPAWVGNNSTAYAQGGGNGVNAQNLGRGMVLSATIGPDMQHIQIAKQVGALYTNNVNPRPFNNLEDHPFWVGQRILVGGNYSPNPTGGGTSDAKNRGKGATTAYDFTGAAELKTRRIEEIRYNRGDAVTGMPGALNNNGSITLVLNTPLLPGGPLSDNGFLFDITVVGAEAVFGTPQCDYAELVVEKITNPNKALDVGEIQYTTYTTEEFDAQNVTNLQKQFTCEPEAFTLYVMQPFDGTRGCIVSRQNFASRYRLRIDNKDCSSRLINLRTIGGKSNGNDSLHIYKQKTALMNSNRILTDLHERQISIDVSTGASSDPFVTDTFVIGQVLPVTQIPKQVQINIDCVGGGISRLLLAKEVMRSL